MELVAYPYCGFLICILFIFQQLFILRKKIKFLCLVE